MKNITKSLAALSIAATSVASLFLFAVYFDKDAKLCEYDANVNDFVQTDVKFRVSLPNEDTLPAADLAHYKFCKTVSTTPHSLLSKYRRS